MKRAWILALAFATAPVLAEDDASEAAVDTPVLEEYVEVNLPSIPTSSTIATKLPVPLQLTPANVGTVGRPLLYEQDAKALGDALHNVSGLNVQRGSGVSEFFVIRGFDSLSSGLVMTDGAGEPETTLYPMYNVEGVEVLKGPGGFLYGSNPLSGTVNMARKQPLPGRFAVLGAAAGSYRRQEGSLDWNLGADDGSRSFRLNGFWQEDGHYRDEMDSRHVAINPGFAWRIGDKSRLNVSLEYVEADFSPDSGLPLFNNTVPDVPRRRSYQSSDDFSEQTISRLQVDYERKINDRVTLRNKTYSRDLDWRTDGTLLRGLVPSTSVVLRQQGRLDDRQRFVGNQLEAVFSLGRGKVQHRLLAGLETLYTDDEYTFDIVALPTVELFSAQQLATPGCSPPADTFGCPLASSGSVRNRVIAPYLVDQMKLPGNVDVLLGLRYDDIDVDGDVKSLLSVNPAPASVSRDDSELSPMVGVVYAPDPSLSLYLNAGRSYAPPSSRLVDELDPDSREPERGSQLELGVKKQFLDGRLRATWSIYQLERDNIAITGPNFFTQQSGDQRSRGFEFELAAEPRPRLRTFVTYAYTDAELTRFTPFDPQLFQLVDYSGNDPALAPAHLASLWISKTFERGFGLAGGGRYIGEQFISEDNAFELDGALVVDASVFYDFAAWRLKLNLKNVTDEEYEQRGVGGAGSVIPADPFTAFLSADYRF